MHIQILVGPVSHMPELPKQIIEAFENKIEKGIMNLLFATALPSELVIAQKQEVSTTISNLGVLGYGIDIKCEIRMAKPETEETSPTESKVE